jgi:sodium/potassium-transporting ATPase subunit alpha
MTPFKPKKVGFAALTQHLLTIEEVAKLFPESKIDPKSPDSSLGLTEQQVEVLRQQYGLNALTPPPEISQLLLYLRQYADMLMVLLHAAGWLSLITYFFNTSVPLNLYLAVILFAIVFIQCTFTYFQERASHQVMQSFKKMLPAACTVIRGGKKSEMSATLLVPGDIVIIKAGDRIPADLRLIQCNNLKVECSSITGESEPVNSTDTHSQAGTPANESTNLCYSSSFAMDGQAIGVVIATGDASIIGQIAKDTAHGAEVKT